jgi:hypothetical protein
LCQFGSGWLGSFGCTSIRSCKFGMTKKPDATEAPVGLDGHLDVADGGRVGLWIDNVEVVDLMRTKFCWCQEDNVVVVFEAL